MLSFDIRDLESKAAQVSDDLPADDPVWGEEDPRPIGAVHVEGRLSVAGEDRFYFSGHISGSVKMDCRRCLEEVTVGVNESTSFLFAPTGDETAADDPDIFIYDPGMHILDLRPAIRESWLLEVPTLAECSPECRGLCPHCGTNLNTATCNCAAESTDPRWDALRNAAHDASQH